MPVFIGATPRCAKESRATSKSIVRNRPGDCKHRATSLQQPVFAVLDRDSLRALVRIVDLFHLRDIVEVADDVGRAERFACLHLLAMQLLDEANVAALVAPA